MTRQTGQSMKWFDDGELHFALGIEDTFVPQSRPGERAIDEYELTDHYAQVETDLALAKGVGADLLRWGVPWYRIAPEQGRWDWSWIDRAMAEFERLELRPIVDLLHYGTPLWLENQFANPDYPQHIAEFGARFADRFAAVATDYTPVNEPMIHALFSGEYAYWPPYLEGPRGLASIATSLAKGFVLTQQGIADVLGERASFVHVDAGMRYVGDVDAAEHRQTVERLRHQSYLVEDLVTGNVGPDHPLLAQLLSGGVTDTDLDWFARNAVRPDVMGVNYYPRHSTEVFEAGVHHGGGFADPRPFFDAGCDGLAEVLTRYAERYGAPVMLTETCVTGTVDERLAWLDDSVATLHRLRGEGLPVVGMTWWPLFDMYEWTYRHSTAPRKDHLLTMGLYDLVESPGGTLERHRNPVADRFQQHATAALAPSSASA
ncbi:family 1 glycosylhydrolase [Subtercola boreus]|uniref:Beta-glucosidase n=1 Tax=Subtercola boreus TaxID=120213 RepID=A0A3E0W8L3_9MICO|nr:family 1 glycosylhydrolase [Subtercola boreus]RFA18234.1 beta-glucosidase [Subtercola boreus]RFA18626.1 beta-glucosidase [Subtercola boreus]RFA25230.1 beta-glucosidase [Subtercola boreus]